MILVTGGAGFIGGNFVLDWLTDPVAEGVVNLDKLTYAGHLSSTKDFQRNRNYQFLKGDICNIKMVAKAMVGVDIVVHFAAESHVDRSIMGPKIFLETNILGTQIILDEALRNKVKLFHYVSTDEVFGSLPLQPKSQKFN
jgi:dTDP-glucose 4,6-dehydratase